MCSSRLNCSKKLLREAAYRRKEFSMFARLERAGCSRVHGTLMTLGPELSFLIESPRDSVQRRHFGFWQWGKPFPPDQSHGLQHLPRSQPASAARLKQENFYNDAFYEDISLTSPLCDAHVHQHAAHLQLLASLGNWVFVDFLGH